MPPFEAIPWIEDADWEDVDDFMRRRHEQRARLAARASLDVLNVDAEFTWETPEPDRQPGRRTVVITGRGAERYEAPRTERYGARHPVRRRGYSASLRPYERSGFKPDRVAMWAFLLGVVLLIAAVSTSHG